MSRAHRLPTPAFLASGWCLPGMAICVVCAQAVRLTDCGFVHSRQGLSGL